MATKILKFELLEKTIENVKSCHQEYIKIRDEFERQELEILCNTDFKELYGANNDKIRKAHIKKELNDLYNHKNELKIELEYQRNLCDLYKEMIKWEE